MKRARLTKVISGGQTGVDQAALRAAQASGLAIGGWCPPGRESEAGPIPERFPLRETPAERSPDAPQVPRSLRTEWNVRDSDATLILTAQGERGAADDAGSVWAGECARRYGRPLLVCDPADSQAAVRIVKWLRTVPVETLSVGGPSERTQPGIGEAAYALLVDVFGQLAGA
ncbi:MAG TPA: putative molybdenum carrier protein [Thermoanaerobaculia bacterium]|nr:putative molybdenum carrier protein [Thermoanaerobaculia bacterium]